MAWAATRAAGAIFFENEGHQTNFCNRKSSFWTLGFPKKSRCAVNLLEETLYIILKLHREDLILVLRVMAKLTILFLQNVSFSMFQNVSFSVVARTKFSKIMANFNCLPHEQAPKSGWNRCELLPGVF